MTRNADNRTTELKSLSKLKMAGKLRYWRGTIEIPESELHAICDEIQAEHEQAIAATMGVDVKDCESLLWEFIGALDVADATDADKKPIVSDYARHIVSTLWSDGEYEAKMDALLCRLTNGKWSKTRSYDLDFMVSCVDEEYETLYAKELAELGSGTCELEQLSALDVTLNMLDSIEWGACSECGCAVPMDAKFCNECGKAVTR